MTDNIVNIGHLSLDQAIGRNVRLLRLQASLEVENVAKSLDLSPLTYVALETGQGRFSAMQILSLCTLLSVKPSDIYNGVQLSKVTPKPGKPEAICARIYLKELSETLSDDDIVPLVFLCRQLFSQ